MIGGVVLILFTGGDDIYIRAGIVFLGESRFRIQSRGYRVAAVDDGGIAVFKSSWELGRFQFDDFQVLRVGSDIGDDRFDRIDAFF